MVEKNGSGLAAIYIREVFGRDTGWQEALLLDVTSQLGFGVFDVYVDFTSGLPHDNRMCRQLIFDAHRGCLRTFSLLTSLSLMGGESSLLLSRSFCYCVVFWYSHLKTLRICFNSAKLQADLFCHALLTVCSISIRNVFKVVANLVKVWEIDSISRV